MKKWLSIDPQLEHLLPRYFLALNARLFHKNRLMGRLCLDSHLDIESNGVWKRTQHLSEQKSLPLFIIYIPQCWHTIVPILSERIKNLALLINLYAVFGPTPNTPAFLHAFCRRFGLDLARSLAVRYPTPRNLLVQVICYSARIFLTSAY